MIERSRKQKEILDGIRREAAKGLPGMMAIKESAPHSLELDLRCSTTSKGYRVLLERKVSTRVYRVAKVATDGALSRQPDNYSPTGESLNINIDEMEFEGMDCPHCEGGDWRFIKCGCGGLSCAGGVRRIEGKHEHTCPWCGEKGYVEGEIETLAARKASIGQLISGQKAGGLPPPAKGRLDSSSR